MDLLVSAQSISRVELVIRRPVNCKRPTAMVETPDVLLGNVVNTTDLNPISHRYRPSLSWPQDLSLPFAAAALQVNSLSRACQSSTTRWRHRRASGPASRPCPTGRRVCRLSPHR